MALLTSIKRPWRHSGQKPSFLMGLRQEPHGPHMLLTVSTWVQHVAITDAFASTSRPLDGFAFQTHGASIRRIVRYPASHNTT